jgi:hypothetical protein
MRKIDKYMVSAIAISLMPLFTSCSEEEQSRFTVGFLVGFGIPGLLYALSLVFGGKKKRPILKLTKQLQQILLLERHGLLLGGRGRPVYTTLMLRRKLINCL